VEDAMRILINLGEANRRCLDWVKFCDDKGLDYYCLTWCDEDSEIELTEDEAKKHGIIKE
jgi:hypothetical protein